MLRNSGWNLRKILLYAAISLKSVEGLGFCPTDMCMLEQKSAAPSYVQTKIVDIISYPLKLVLKVDIFC